MKNEEKTKIAAVICEYNPMHEGHRAMLRAVREAAGDDSLLLCLMSGDFVQRGEPAVYDKYKRAEEAVKGGADLVLELPYPWSSSVAEHFAFGAIGILRRTGVQSIYFGSEKKDTAELAKISARLRAPLFREALAQKRKTEKQTSFPRLTAQVYAEVYGEELTLSPNEILGVQYLSEIAKSGAKIEAHALPMLEGFSASAIRMEMQKDPAPDTAFLANGERAILTMLTLSSGKDRFSKAAHRCASLDELFETVRNPSDTDARLRRELLSTLLSSGGREKSAPLFTVLLAANERGLRLPAALRKSEDFTVVTKHARPPKSAAASEQFALYTRAERFYALFTTAPQPADFLALKHPYIEK